MEIKLGKLSADYLGKNTFEDRTEILKALLEKKYNLDVRDYEHSYTDTRIIRYGIEIEIDYPYEIDDEDVFGDEDDDSNQDVINYKLSGNSIVKYFLNNCAKTFKGAYRDSSLNNGYELKTFALNPINYVSHYNNLKEFVFLISHLNMKGGSSTHLHLTRAFKLEPSFSEKSLYNDLRNFICDNEDFFATVFGRRSTYAKFNKEFYDRRNILNVSDYTIEYRGFKHLKNTFDLKRLGVGISLYDYYLKIRTDYKEAFHSHLDLFKFYQFLIDMQNTSLYYRHAYDVISNLYDFKTNAKGGYDIVKNIKHEKVGNLYNYYN